jgi:hypothetical protein
VHKYFWIKTPAISTFKLPKPLPTFLSHLLFHVHLLSLFTILFSSTPLLKKNALAYTSALAKRLELFKVKVLLSLFLDVMVSRIASKHY